MQVAWLGEPASLDAATVGGKTANLGRLATSFRVPPGFCLDVSAFDELRHALDGDAAARARLRELVAASYADLASRVGEREPHVAVRSSAIGEDSGDASFAGQHETVLDVGGVDAIVDALLECWRSVYSDRAAVYRRQRGMTGTPRIAVLVQVMVPADALAIASRTTANGGVLPDRDIAGIARLAMQLEKVMGGPVDIECALRDGELHLLQCRPITTLADQFPVTWDDPEDAKLTWTREDAHFDSVFAPLSTEFITNGPDYGIRKRLGSIGFPLLVRHRAFNGRFYASEKPLVTEDRLPAELTRAATFRRVFARTLRRAWDDEYLPELRGHYEWMRGVPIGALSRDDLAEAWLEMWRRVNRIWTIHFIVTGSAYPVMEELAQAYETLVGANGAEALAVTQGSAPTLQRLERDLHALTEAARRLPAVAAAIAQGERALPNLVGLEDGSEFARELDAFLNVHGDIGQENFDIESPAWSADPAKLIGLLAQRLRSHGEHPDARVERVRARARDIMQRARAHLADRPEDLARFRDPRRRDQRRAFDRGAQLLDRSGLTGARRPIRARDRRAARCRQGARRGRRDIPPLRT